MVSSSKSTSKYGISICRDQCFHAWPPTWSGTLSLQRPPYSHNLGLGMWWRFSSPLTVEFITDRRMGSPNVPSPRFMNRPSECRITQRRDPLCWATCTWHHYRSVPHDDCRLYGHCPLGRLCVCPGEYAGGLRSGAADGLSPYGGDTGLCPGAAHRLARERSRRHDARAGARASTHPDLSESDSITPALVRRLHAEGFVVRAWGVVDEVLMPQVVEAGADGMTVNFPNTLLAYIQG